LRDEKRRRFAALLCQSACTERPNPPLLKEETPLSSNDRGIHRHTIRKEIA
jgi:hypothetical protein